MKLRNRAAVAAIILATWALSYFAPSVPTLVLVLFCALAAAFGIVLAAALCAISEEAQ